MAEAKGVFKYIATLSVCVCVCGGVLRSADEFYVSLTGLKCHKNVSQYNKGSCGTGVW